MIRSVLPVCAAVVASVFASCSGMEPAIGTPLITPSDAAGSVAYPKTDAGKLMKGGSSGRIADVPWDTTCNVTSGLDYYKMKVVTDAGERLDVCLLRADVSKGIEMKVAVSEKTTSSSWYLSKLSDMAAQINTLSKPLYAMVNADFCDNRQPVRPRGPVHSAGSVLVPTYSLDGSFTHQGLSYVGMTYTGKMTIGPREEYDSVKESLKECTGGGVILLHDSEIQGGYVTSNGRDPRTATGYTPDNIIWILVVDGRHNGTEGMTYMEMASIFQALGCETAVNLDGGGSTEMLVRNPRTGKVEICNWPSDPTDGDGGQERPRLNAWAIVKK